MEEDLGLKGNQFQTAVSILFVTYLLSEVPSNLVLKKFTPSRLLVSAAIAGAVGGLLAYGIGFMDGVAGQRGWRWILIIEGLPTLILGVVTWFLLADSPETAFYLSSQEKELMRIRRERQTGQTQSAQELHRRDVLAGLRDWKIYAFCAGQFGVDTMLYGYSTFLPTIIADLGKWTTAEVQALTIPCYCLGAISYLVAARLSDTQQRRGMYTVIFGAISVVGYGVLISDSSIGVHYFGCFLIALGLYVVVGLPLAWLPSNQPRYGKRTTATGLQLTVGNASGVMAPFLYPSTEKPRYVRGNGVSLSLVGTACLIYALMSWILSQKNAGRRAGKEDDKIAHLTESEIAELGDDSPRFVYTI
ncbi:MAG: hypothetical protein LQ342_002837 [Letrouitia transgressa]|nr:MAG: hypothetical protein LQ342_002837 [Letrouitia transgressa]